jgi:hypothetical protein
VRSALDTAASAVDELLAEIMQPDDQEGRR